METLLKALLLTTDILSLPAAVGLAWLILFPEYPERKSPQEQIKTH